MRMLMKVNLDTATGNNAVRNGTLGSTIKSILDEIKPEAAYFTDDGGERTAYIFFDMKDASQIPSLAEPFFLAFNAKVHFRPAMNLGDLAQAGPGIDAVAKKYGKAGQ
jgi:hypothetical protein